MGLLSFFRSLRHSSRAAVQARVEAVHRRVAALSATEAEVEARDCLERVDPFHTELPSESDSWVAATDLPATVRSLFENYVAVGAGGCELRREDVAPYARDSALIRIGSDMEHADVVARQSDGHVFVIEDDGTSELDLSDEHATVWHYLLEVADHTR